MRKILLLILLIPCFVYGQSPVINSAPQKWLKWGRFAGSLFSDSAMVNSDSTNRVPNSAWDKRNFAQIIGSTHYIQNKFGSSTIQPNSKISVDSVINTSTGFNLNVSNTATSTQGLSLNNSSSPFGFSPYLIFEKTGIGSGANKAVRLYSSANTLVFQNTTNLSTWNNSLVVNPSGITLFNPGGFAASIDVTGLTAARQDTIQDKGGKFAFTSDIPGSLPPSGAAGGALNGTYPNPGLNNITQSQVTHLPDSLLKKINYSDTLTKIATKHDLNDTVTTNIFPFMDVAFKNNNGNITKLPGFAFGYNVNGDEIELSKNVNTIGKIIAQQPLTLAYQSATPATPATGFGNFYMDNVGRITWLKADGFTRKLSFPYAGSQVVTFEKRATYTVADSTDLNSVSVENYRLPGLTDDSVINRAAIAIKKGGKIYLDRINHPIYTIINSIRLDSLQTLDGRGATIKRGNASVSTLSATMAGSATSFTVSSVPADWKVGDLMQVYTDTTGAHSNNTGNQDTHITSITGTTITVDFAFGNSDDGSITTWPIGTHVRKTYNMIMPKTSPYVANQSYSLYNITFDGNKAGNNQNYFWASDFTIFCRGFQSVISNCKFFDIPVENIVGQGFHVDGNTARRLNGSFVHIAGKNNIAINNYEQQNLWITNNYVDSVNLIGNAIMIHSNDAITFSFNGGNSTITGNRMKNGKEGIFAPFGGSSPPGSIGGGRLVFSNNICENFAAVTGFGPIVISALTGSEVSNSIFKDCGTTDFTNANLYGISFQGLQTLGNTTFTNVSVPITYVNWISNSSSPYVIDAAVIKFPKVPTTSTGSLLALGADSTLHVTTVATANIANNAVTYAKMQAVTTNKLLGSGSGTSVAEITLGTGLSFTGTTLNATATAVGGSNTQLQYNNSGVFGGISGATTNGTVVTLTTPVIGATTYGGVGAFTFTPTLTANSTPTFLSGAGTVPYLGSSNVFTSLQSVQVASQQLSLNFDGTNKTAFTTSSSGNLTVAPTGGTTAFTGFVSITNGITNTAGSTPIRSNFFSSQGTNNFLSLMQSNANIAGVMTTASSGIFSNTSGQSTAFAITPSYNQVTSTAVNTDLLINRTETSLGSGAQLLTDWQVGGVSKASINNSGNLKAVLPSYSSGTANFARYNTSNNRFENYDLFGSNNTFTAAQTINGSLAVGAAGLASPVFYYGTSTGYVGLSASTYSGSTAYNQTLQAANGVVALTSQVPIHGNSTTTGTATTSVTVTIGTTMANSTYFTKITPRDALTGVNYYIDATTGQSTTTFTVTFLTALTGSINFDWEVTP